MEVGAHFSGEEQGSLLDTSKMLNERVGLSFGIGRTMTGKGEGGTSKEEGKLEKVKAYQRIKDCA